MKLYKLSFVLGALALSLSGFSQTDEDYAALASFIPEETISDLSQNDELRYKRLAVTNRHAYYVSEMGEKDWQSLPNALEVEKIYEDLPDLSLELIQNQELNLLGYEFQFLYEKYTYYKLNDTGQVLVIMPLKLLYKRENLEE